MNTPLRFLSAVLLVSSLSNSATYAQTLPLPTHIVVLFEENYAYPEIIGSSSAPYINAICADTAHAAVFSNFYAIEHPSQPNYLDIFSGENQGMVTDDLPSTDGIATPFTTPNLCAELLAAGKTFKTYSENLPSVGYNGEWNDGDDYARKHNPSTNWVGTANQFSDTVNQPWTAFPTNYSNLPTVSFVVPNETDDMHDYTCSSLPCPESIAIGDTWEHTNMDSLKKWTLANNTLYIIIYDEDDDAHSNWIPTIFYGPMVKGGTYTETINHYNLLRTIEDMYSLGHAGNAATATPITDCWRSVSAAVNNVAANYAFKVMPNPASDVINFNCNNSAKTQLSISIMDEVGHVAGNYTMDNDELQVNTSSYAPGVYSYRVVNNNNNIVEEGKFVVSHN